LNTVHTDSISELLLVPAAKATPTSAYVVQSDSNGDHDASCRRGQGSSKGGQTLWLHVEQQQQQDQRQRRLLQTQDLRSVGAALGVLWDRMNSHTKQGHQQTAAMTALT
jgi:hypothetical protein